MIYLDNAATTKPVWTRSAYEAVDYAWFNANSNMQARKLLDDSRENIKKALGFKSGKVLFCRSSTEAVEWLIGELKNFGYTILCSKYEHDSVWDRRHGTLSDKSPVQYGSATFIQMVNQMTGCVQDVARWKDDRLQIVGCDLTATVGKYPIPDNLETQVEAVWFGGHKIHAEKNIAVLWLSDRLWKLLGGWTDSRNEYNLIHGTADVCGAMMMEKATRAAVKLTDSLRKCSVLLNKNLVEALVRNDIHAEFVLPSSDCIDRTEAINAITLKGLDADALTQYLASKEIYVGKGASACSSLKDYRVLEAHGLSRQDAEQTIRVSYSIDNEVEDVVTLANEIAQFKKLFV